MTPEGLTALADVERPSNPFPGLRPFEFGESHLYFGRDGQSDQLIRKLAATRFVAVVGTSGSGKSSLVRAGLLPDLFSGFMPSAGTHWRVCLLRPGSDPLGNLARVLNTPGVFGSEIEENARIQTAITEATLRRGSLGLVEAVRQNRMASNESLLVVVDQFEELFRFARVAASEQYRYEAAAFVKLLLGAAQQREQQIYVVLTMRSDFLGDCSIFWGLPEAINDGQYLIPRMTRDQRAEAIKGPVAVGGGEIAQRLVNRLLNDTGDNPDMLPILQHALMRTWENWAGDHRVGEPVDLRHYEAVGTMSDALSLHADEAFDELPDERSRQLAELLFKGLTEKGEDNREIRRPTVLGELCAQVGATLSDLIPVIELFRREGRSFLMPPAAVPLDEESLIDISHESLIRNWQRLRDWVDEESQSAQTYARLAETAVLHGRAQAGLWRDPDLQGALDWRARTRPTAAWAARYQPAFDAAMSFLDASVAARDAAALEEERRRRREIRRTRTVAVFFFLLFMLALVAFAFAYTKTLQAQEALGEAEQARTRAEAANQRAERALAEAVRERDRAHEQSEIARRNEEAAQAAKTLAEEKKKEAEESKAAAVKSAESARLNARRAEAARLDAERQRAETEAQKTTAEAAAERNRQLLYASEMTLAQQAYDAGNVRYGRMLLLSQAGGSRRSLGFEFFYLWNLFNREQATEDLGGWNGRVNLLNDNRVLAVERPGGVELRDAATRKLLRSMATPDGPRSALAVSPDGRLLAHSEPDSTEVTLLDSQAQKTSKLSEHKAGVMFLDFSPDGRTLAVGTANAGLRRGSELALWDVATAGKKRSYTRFSSIRALTFSPDGARLAVGERNGQVALVDAETGLDLCQMETGQGAAFADADSFYFAFSPAGDTLATVGSNGTIRVFRLSDCREVSGFPGRLVGEELNGMGKASPTSLVFSPDGSRVAVSYVNNTVEVWNSTPLTTRTPLATIKGHDGYINSTTFLSDNRTLVTSGQDGALKVWDTLELEREQAALSGHAGSVRTVAFAPDGRSLVSGGARGLLRWDAETGEILKTPRGDNDGDIYQVAFAPDGRTFVSAADGNAPLVLRDANTLEKLGEFPLQSSMVFSAAYSPDGARLVTCDGGPVFKLWDVATGTLLRQAAHGGNVFRVVFSPDGKMIVSGSRQGEVKLWDATLSKELDTILREGVESKSGLNALAFSPDGSQLAVAFERDVVLFDPLRSTSSKKLLGHKGDIYSLAFSPDGKTLASGDAEHTIKLWATVSGKEVIELRGHTGAVMSLSFSRDGRKLASASFDGTVRLWRAAAAGEVSIPSGP